jgi:hypothetical protein
MSSPLNKPGPIGSSNQQIVKVQDRPSIEGDNKCSKVWEKCCPWWSSSKVALGFSLSGKLGRVESEEMKEMEEDSLNVTSEHVDSTGALYQDVAKGKLSQPIMLLGVTFFPGDTVAENRKNLRSVAVSGNVSLKGSNVEVLKTEGSLSMQVGELIC